MRAPREILLVEDSENDAELIVEALRSAGIKDRVVVARDGVEGRDYLESRRAQSAEARSELVVIFLDLKMPRISGLELLRIIREDPAWAKLPVVALTSSKETRDIEEAYRLGANAFVVKPIDFQELMECVRHLGRFWARINEPPPIVCA